MNKECPVKLKWYFWYFLTFSPAFFLFRPCTKCGADPGETVLGREAECSRGAAADVRTGVRAAAAAAVSRKAASAWQRQTLLHCSNCTAESESLDRREVRILKCQHLT